MNPISLAIGMGAGFVARSFSGDKTHLSTVIAQAISFKGYALVDILQPCPSFNRINTFKWYKDRLYYLPEDYDSSDILQARDKAEEWGERIPIGIIYRSEKPEYIAENSVLRDNPPLVNLPFSPTHAQIFMDDFR